MFSELSVGIFVHKTNMIYIYLLCKNVEMNHDIFGCHLISHAHVA